MANYTADLQATVDGPAYGQPLATRVKANRSGGRIRTFHSLFRAPASGSGPAIGDKIIWGKLPVGARILGHLSRLDFSAGTASSTLNVGDNTLAARHLAATSVASASTAVPNAAIFSSTCVADTTVNSVLLTNVKGLGACGVGDVLSGTGIATGAYVTAIDKLAKTVTMSLAATATNAAQTVTAVGTPYETSDDSANLANSYTSTYDDATLVSTVAGAQIANNQVISLHIAYVLD